MAVQKFPSGDIVNYTDPSTKEEIPVRIVKCDPDDPIEPFYTIWFIKEFTLTHAFERSLSAIEADEEEG